MKDKTFVKNKIESEKVIIYKIIRRGGLMGRCADMIKHDKEKSEQFILECSEQSNNPFLNEYFGEELVKEIINFNKEYHSKKRKQFNINKKLNY